MSLLCFVVLAVLLKDVIMRSTLGRYIRVVVPAQDIRCAVQGVMANSPTSFGVAIDLTNAGVYPDSNCTYESRLSEVGTKAGPEVVVQVRPTMKRSCVKCQPVSHRTEECDEEGHTHHQKNEEEDKSQFPRMSTVSGSCGHGRRDAGPILGRRSRG